MKEFSKSLSAKLLYIYTDQPLHDRQGKILSLSPEPLKPIFIEKSIKKICVF